MAESHILNLGWTDRSTTINAPVTTESEGENNRDVDVTAGVQLEVSIAFPTAALKSLFILSDVAATIKTNVAATPGNTLTLAAGKPLIWYDGCGLANPFSVDVTKFFLDAATAARVRIKVLCDVTP